MLLVALGGQVLSDGSGHRLGQAQLPGGRKMDTVGGQRLVTAGGVGEDGVQCIRPEPDAGVGCRATGHAVRFPDEEPVVRESAVAALMSMRMGASVTSANA